MSKTLTKLPSNRAVRAYEMNWAKKVQARLKTQFPFVSRQSVAHSHTFESHLHKVSFVVIMTRTRARSHSFSQVDGLWINPLTNLPFQRNGVFESKKFWCHTKRGPKFGPPTLKYESCIVVDGQCLHPETKEPFRYGDVYNNRVFLQVKNNRPHFLTLENFENRKRLQNKFARGIHRKIGSVATQLMCDARRRSAKRGGIMTLTQTWIRDQITRGCSITGIPFQLGAQDKTSSP